MRSTLLLKEKSLFVIKAEAFLILLHSQLKKNVKEDQKIKKEFVRESLPNHPRNVKSVNLINHLNQNVKSQNLKVAKNHLHQKVANQKNLNVLKILISLVKIQIQRNVENINKAKVDQIATKKTKKEPLTHQILDVVTLFLHL